MRVTTTKGSYYFTFRNKKLRNITNDHYRHLAAPFFQECKLDQVSISYPHIITFFRAFFTTNGIFYLPTRTMHATDAYTNPLGMFRVANPSPDYNHHVLQYVH